MKNNGKKLVLVTGGAGFIGSNLCERLLRDGHKVISLDNYFTGSRDNHIEGVEYREGHTKDIELSISESPDIVYHLGEYPRVEQSFTDTKRVFDFNIVGTQAVLEFCRQRMCKIVYAGSSTKFSDNGLGRYQSPYAWTKASNTDLIKNYAAWFGIPHVITYFYNVYGPRERAGKYGTVIEIFKEQYRQGQPLTVRAPGTQRRNFTHVNDIVEGLVMVGEKGDGDEYGLGAEKSYSILEIAEMFATKIEMLPDRPGNRLDANLDLTKSRALGWSAKISINDYVKEFIKSREI